MPHLRKASSAYQRAELRRDEEIYRAFLAGNSLRAIATEVDLSHESVRSVVLRIGAWIEREDTILRQTKDASASTSDQRIAAERRWQERREHLDWLTSVNDSDE